MDLTPCDLKELPDRIAKLENQNRRLRQLGVMALIVALLLLTTGQVPSRKSVEANEFILKDVNGNVRARLSVDMPGSSKLVLYDEEGKQRIKLDGGIGMPGLTVYDFAGRARAEFLLVLDATALFLRDDKGVVKTGLKEGAIVADQINAGHVQTLDADGFQAILGTADLVTPRTGEKHTTSAASLVFFDKSKNVIWKAP